MALTKTNLANIVEGVLPVANGGTGTSTGPAAGGSTTQVQYNNAGAFGGDSGFVYTGDNVGIGTSSPYSKLDIVQATGGYGGWKYALGLNATDYPALRFLATTANTGNLIGHDTGSLVFLNGTTATSAGTERFRVGPSGQWGIGGANYGTSGQVLTSGGSGAAPSWGSVSLPAGTIKQTVGFSTSTSTSTNSGTYVSTTLSASITPSSASNKIIVMAYCPYSVNNGGSGYYECFGVLGVFRNSTVIEEQQVGYNLFSNSNSKSIAGSWCPIIVDSPATTSSVNYNVQLKTGSTNFTIQLRVPDFYANPSNLNNNARLLLMEVVG